MSNVIDMLGREIGPWQVVDKAPTRGKGARWIVICLTCKTQSDRSGHSLRRHAGDDETMFLRCEECGA
jgi:DNA-directed RNA polymerase subunit M/transcription elongation factor TFIIS